MHLEPNQVLFSRTTRLNIHQDARLLILGLGLVILTASSSQALAWIISAVFVILGIYEGLDRIRVYLLFTCLANFMLVSIVWFWLGIGSESASLQLVKSFASFSVLSWFGVTNSWTSLKRRYLQHRKFASLTASMDQGILQGQILLQQIQRRFDAAFVRIGRRYQMPHQVGSALAGGIASAFERSIFLRDAKMLRAYPNVLGTAHSLPIQPKSLNRPILLLEQISVTFVSGQEGLSRVSFVLHGGTWLLLAGPSGSGKSTLLRTIVGLQEYRGGPITCLDRPVMFRKHMPEIGLIFQNPDEQFFASTPLDDVIWGLRQRGFSQKESQSKAFAWLERLHIGHLADHPLSSLSFGEKKRVAFAAILACEPQVLLCDEPTVGLDPRAARQLIHLLEELTLKYGISVIWASHDLHALPPKLTAGLLLRGGKQIFFGDLETCMSRSMLDAGGLL